MGIREEMKAACEIVHYSVMNNTPVDLKHIYLIDPQFQAVKEYQQQEQYNDYLKHKQGDDNVN